MKFRISILLFAAAVTYPAFAQTNVSTLQVNDTATFGLAPDAGSFEWRDNGILLSKGQMNQGSLLPSDLIPVSGGTSLLWLPAKAAFRAGIGMLGDNSFIGAGSAAFGRYNDASGDDSISGGLASYASGAQSFAYGFLVSAPGAQAIVAGGQFNTASGRTSAIIGGGHNQATGAGTFVSGSSNQASGNLAVAFGENTIARASHVFAIGRYNVGGYLSPTGDTSWVLSDPLFEIGNGERALVGNDWTETRSNALTVYKNGNATFQGVVRVAPGGDIPMYSGN